LRLFIAEDADLGIRPERMLRETGETEFIRRHQSPVRSLAAFEQSIYADDWRDLMRLYMVRRTRSFIQNNYAETDGITGRKYLTFADGTRSYFPTRQPKTLKFAIDDSDPHDQYAFLYSDLIVATINALALPRYGLGNYVKERPHEPPTAAEARVIADLSRAGKRLMGFCRTNLFKRLESSRQAFIQSVERYILRNFVYLHAVEHDQPLPIGTQDASVLDVRFTDTDTELFMRQRTTKTPRPRTRITAICATRTSFAAVLMGSTANTLVHSRASFAGSVPIAFRPSLLKIFARIMMP
jgi:hypothetical protein